MASIMRSSAAAAPMFFPSNRLPQKTHRCDGRRFRVEFSIRWRAAQATQDATASQGKVNVSSNQIQRLTITRPDDWHLHVRDGDVLSSVVPHSASTFRRAIIMPNLKPPVTTVAAARAYRERILSVLPSNSEFEPLMTLYLTDSTTRDEIKLAKESGIVVAVKLYPAGATTNSQAGVTDLFGKCMPVLEEMAEQGLPLLVHGEVADQDVDIFDRERVFIETVLSPLVERIPHLKVVMEHITTQDAVEFIKSRSNGLLSATVTPQHLLLNRNAIFKGGLQPHNYCLPVLKREKHRQALVSAVTSGSKQYFLGTDSAPHERQAKETSCGCAGIYSAPVALPLYAQVFDQAGALDKLEAFASFNGPLFYGLPVNRTTVTLDRVPWKIPTDYKFGSGIVIPICAGVTGLQLVRSLALHPKWSSPIQNMTAICIRLVGMDSGFSEVCVPFNLSQPLPSCKTRSCLLPIQGKETGEFVLKGLQVKIPIYFRIVCERNMRAIVCASGSPTIRII